jgi:DNA replication licensing factor MCM6
MSAPIMSRFDLFFVVLDECDEAVDRHLAEHIVGIHKDRDDAVTPEYSTEQLQRYIRFAKTFRPEFSDEARETLVEKYKELRADDAQGGIGRNSYRITVRQLESMIRLSEAIAKANCVNDITPDFVKEAYNLLRQSIISVEKDDVEMEDEDDEAVLAAAAAAEGQDGDAPMDEDQQDASRDRTATPTPAPREKTKITHDKYIAMRNMFVKRVNEDQEETQDGVEEEELLVWYLEQKEATLETQEDMEAERALAKKVLKKVVKVCFEQDLSRDPKTNHYIRNNTSCLSVAKVLQTSKETRGHPKRLCMCCILIAQLRTSPRCVTNCMSFSDCADYLERLSFVYGSNRR